MVKYCAASPQVHTSALQFACLAQHHFEPEVVETSPYETVSHAVLEWVKEEPERWRRPFLAISIPLPCPLSMASSIHPFGNRKWSECESGFLKRPVIS